MFYLKGNIFKNIIKRKESHLFAYEVMKSSKSTIFYFIASTLPECSQKHSTVGIYQRDVDVVSLRKNLLKNPHSISTPKA